MPVPTPNAGAESTGAGAAGKATGKGSRHRVLEFARRADLYRNYDHSFSAHTRFFAAAALTNRVISELLSRSESALLLSSRSLACLQGMGRDLETFNRAIATRIPSLRFCGSVLDLLLVGMEQCRAERYLAGRAATDPGAVAGLIREMNRLMRLIVATPAPARVSPAVRLYGGVVCQVHLSLKRDLDFGRREDREHIGYTLTHRLQDPERSRQWRHGVPVIANKQNRLHLLV